jgi:protein-tyrosine phosphatase
MIRVCFVCLGNICRSPTAEGVMRKLVADAGLAAQIDVESAGTSAHHVGERPDPRSRAAARARGIDLTSRARQFEPQDLARFDYVLAADRRNLADLRALAAGRATTHVTLLRSFDPASPSDAEVPDPYYGEDGFDDVLDLCESACRGLLAHIVREHGLSPTHA